MKKFGIKMSVVALLITLSTYSLFATMYRDDIEHPNAAPGDAWIHTVNVDPYECSSAIGNHSGSGDHLYANMYHDNPFISGDEEKWGGEAETWNAEYRIWYYTPASTVSCTYWDGSYGESRNISAPVEDMIIRYEYYV